MSDFKSLLKSNYSYTFVKSLIPAVNAKFAKGNIDRIDLIPGVFPNEIGSIEIYDNKGNIIKNKEVEKKIMKFYTLKRKAFEKNSDYYFKERKTPKNTNEQKESIYHRSLGEESYFNY